MKVSTYNKYLSHKIATSKFLSILCFPLYIISLLVPKNKKIKLFGSMNGYQVVDNAKYMFINEYKKGYYFITKNKQILDTPIFSDVYPVFCYSLKGLLLQLIAKEVYYTHSVFDFFSPLIMGADVIALWHGVPGKKINTALLEQKKYLKKLPFFLYTYIFPYKYYAYCNYVYCPNENLLDIYKECFQIGKPQILIHKQPRNLYAKKIDKQERLILYAPTYRKDQKLINVMKSLDFFEEQTKEFICSSGIKIVVRPHPIDVQELEKEELPEYLVIDKSKDIYETINKYELVITDFSSLFYDAQEQEIDVRILQNDLDLYNDSNGLFTQFYDYIKANSKCSLVEILKDIIEG